MVRLRMLAPHLNLMRGEEASFDAAIARGLVAAGVAVAVDDAPTEAPAELAEAEGPAEPAGAEEPAEPVEPARRNAPPKPRK